MIAAPTDHVALVVADSGHSVDSVLEMIHRAAGEGRESVLLVIESDVAAINRAMLRAAIGPLAIELAPEIRLNALDVAAGAAAADVAAAATFLAAAGSTTGQLLAISQGGSTLP